MTIQGPSGNISNHPEPIRGNGNASRAHQAPFTTPLPVDHLLGKLFKYLTRCARGADTPPTPPLEISPPPKGGGLVWFGSRPVPDAQAHGQHSSLCQHEWARRVAVVRSQGLPDC